MSIAAFVSASLALVYCIAKIDLAIKGNIGMPGIPLSDSEAARSVDLVWLRQLGNAAVGLSAALLAMATCLTRHDGPLSAEWSSPCGSA